MQLKTKEKITDIEFLIVFPCIKLEVWWEKIDQINKNSKPRQLIMSID